ncbi:RecT family recombinase [Serratia marcescens]|uniref:RecT family recombinase n=1 Tax=Serratia marcescens TaxID=615 RepID=UPI0006663145|nr:RecT family recombinase [Serratia marcescens]EJC0202561.1 recombinase RecT [Serratia marcescens]EME9756680.1 recombinase RecT [Serratia marcescens]MDP8626937.1 RecT family recombinase [Serratia marcescens]MDP8676371.1 RecT family recombinase [Serratia marcescens]MDP8691374.1 RecT family recombinase [Serratia marcescens]
MSFSIIEFVKQQEPLFSGALTDQSVTWAKESQFAMQLFQKNDFLTKTAIGNPASAQNAIINVAAIGITLNPASKLAYLVPRDGMVCLDISYMGLLHLAQATGSIKWGQCKLVYSNDTYESNGLDSAPTHKYNAFGDRGEVVGGYCTVKTPDGDYLTEEMSLSEIKATEATSKAKNGPWKTFWAEMARKTIVKRASKYWPRAERLDAAIEYMNTDGGEGINLNQERSQERDISPAAIETLQSITDLLTKMDKTWGDMLPLCSQIFGRTITAASELTEVEAVKAHDFLIKRTKVAA